MTESQSRFSIIDELVQKKTNCQNQILAEEKSVSDKEFEIATWEDNVLRSREVNTKNLAKMKTDVAKKVEVLKQQIVEYQNAISAVQGIQTK